MSRPVLVTVVCWTLMSSFCVDIANSNDTNDDSNSSVSTSKSHVESEQLRVILKALNSMRTEISNLKNSVAAVPAVDMVNPKLDLMRAEIRDLKTLVKPVANGATLDQVREEIGSLRALVADGSKLDLIRAETDNLNTFVESFVNDSRFDTAAIRAEIDTLKTIIGPIAKDSKLDLIRAEISDLKTLVTPVANDSRLDLILGGINSLKTLVTDGSKLNFIQADIDSLKTFVDSDSSKLDVIRSEIGILKMYMNESTSPTTTTTTSTSDRCPTRLENNVYLRMGSSICSPSGNAHLSMQFDGNLVLYRTCDFAPIWTTHTFKKAVSVGAKVSLSGTLSFQSNSSSTLFSTNTDGHYGGVLEISDDGYLCLRQLASNLCYYNSRRDYPNGNILSDVGCKTG